MYIKRTEFDKIQKRLAEYRQTNYDLQLENETLRECTTTAEEALKKKKVKEIAIKIRYAYIISPTTMKQDPRYYETLVFTVLPLKEIEGTYVTLAEQLTQGEAILIKILGRDVCTDRVDMDCHDIYTGDIIRWVGNGGERDEIVTPTTNFYELETSKDCKVIGSIYDKAVI